MFKLFMGLSLLSIVVIVVHNLQNGYLIKQDSMKMKEEIIKNNMFDSDNTVILIFPKFEKGTLAFYVSKNSNWDQSMFFPYLSLDMNEDVNKKEDIILKQNPEVGTTVNEGSTVTLYIPDIKIVYPDFTDGSYTEASVRDFCEKYNVILTVEYDTNTNYPEGTIIHQTRDANTPVTGNATFGITVAKNNEETPEG